MCSLKEREGDPRWVVKGRDGGVRRCEGGERRSEEERVYSEEGKVTDYQPIRVPC